MSGVVQFIRSLIMLAIVLGALGTLVEATGMVGKAALEAHKKGGISFKQLNRQLIGR